MKSFILLTLLITIILSSCNSNSQQQKEQQEKVKMDSVATAVKNTMEKKISLQNQVTEISEHFKQLNESLKGNIASLEGEKTKMQSVQDFHLLRTSSEKAEQVKNQTLVILNLEERIDSIKKLSSDLENQKNGLEQELKSFN